MHRVARAPGRVNLIGGHVDFHEGPIVATAMELGVTCSYRPTDDGRVVVRSDAYDGVVDVSADGAGEVARVEPRWGRLAAAVVSELASLGRPAVGIDAAVTSDLPAGCGLSSSAAFEVAIALA